MDLKALTNRFKELMGKRGSGGGTQADGGDVSGAQPGGGAAPDQPYSSQVASPPTSADQPDATATQPGTPDDGMEADAADRDVGEPGGGQPGGGQPGGGQMP